jgi:hypothetical protein
LKLFQHFKTILYIRLCCFRTLISCCYILLLSLFWLLRWVLFCVCELMKHWFNNKIMENVHVRGIFAIVWKRFFYLMLLTISGTIFTDGISKNSNVRIQYTSVKVISMLFDVSTDANTRALSSDWRWAVFAASDWGGRRVGSHRVDLIKIFFFFKQLKIST